MQHPEVKRAQSGREFPADFVALPVSVSVRPILPQSGCLALVSVQYLSSAAESAPSTCPGLLTMSVLKFREIQ